MDTRKGSGPTPRLLYVVYWGAAEPLGQSLVLPAVTRLADLGAKITLVTFEKPGDLARSDVIAEIRASLSGHGVPLDSPALPQSP